jgi:pyruvate/2-oxoglutarate dehydrogenase complex dihydrolipoamide acyltransferase (E2) component
MFKKRLLLFALALAGAGAALQLTRGTATETPIKPPPYEPATRDKDGLIAAAGLVEAVAENTLLGSPTSGTVAKVHVKVWDKVKAGDPILTLDDRDLRAQHAVQKAAVEAAAATADRAADAARRWTGIKVGGVRRRPPTSLAYPDGGRPSASAGRGSRSPARSSTRPPCSSKPASRFVRPSTPRCSRSASAPADFVASGAEGSGRPRRHHPPADPLRRSTSSSPRACATACPPRATSRARAPSPAPRTCSIALKFVRIEPFVIPKTSPTGASIVARRHARAAV